MAGTALIDRIFGAFIEEAWCEPDEENAWARFEKRAREICVGHDIEIRHSRIPGGGVDVSVKVDGDELGFKIE